MSITKLILRRDKGSMLTQDELDDNLLYAAASGGSQSNVVKGGNFHTNPWTLGIQFDEVEDGAYTANHWKYIRKNSTARNTVARVPDAPLVEETGVFSLNSLGVAVTTNDTSQTSNDLVALSAEIGGYDFTRLAQQVSVLSFWVKYTAAGTFGVAVRNSGKDRSFVSSFTIDSANTWEKKTIVVPASPEAGTWDYEAGVGAELVFVLMAGSSYHGTAGEWNTGNFLTIDTQTNACDSISNVFKLAFVKWEPGETATPFTNKDMTLEYLDAQSGGGSSSVNNISLGGSFVLFSGQTTVPGIAGGDRVVDLPAPVSTVAAFGPMLNEFNSNGVHASLVGGGPTYSRIRFQSNFANSTKISWILIGELA